MKIERMNKKELDEYCESLGIDIKKKKKTDLIKAFYEYERARIDEAIASGNCQGGIILCSVSDQIVFPP